MRELKRKTEENPRTRRADTSLVFARRDYNNFIVLSVKKSIKNRNTKILDHLY